MKKAHARWMNAYVVYFNILPGGKNLRKLAGKNLHV